MTVPPLVPRLMVIVGVVLIVYGLLMDTSVQSSFGSVVNLSLLARQTNLLIVGAVSLIGGILLHGISQLQKPQEQLQREKREEEARIEAGRESARRFRGKLSESVVQAKERLSQKSEPPKIDEALKAELDRKNYGIDELIERIVSRVRGMFRR